MTVTMFEAKTKLSELVRKAMDGEEVVITSGRDRTPVARIEPMHLKTTKRLGARLDPNYVMSEGFLDPTSDEEIGKWEGGEV